MKLDFAIGIDPGVKTGFAVWDVNRKKLTLVSTCGIIEAMSMVKDMHNEGGKIVLRFEDCRQRTWFGSKGREVLKGVGSVNRDCSIWQEFCLFHSIDYQAIHPKATITKMKSDRFNKLTGYQGRTSEHARDAAMLVFGM